jgi:AcrR family transcriptional regulator
MQPMLEEKTYHHPDLPRRLIVAARAELAEKGVRGFSLRSVAAKSGVSRTAPYRHFPGKEGLLAVLMRQGFTELTAALRDADEGERGDDFAKLLAQGRAYIQFGRTCPEMLELIFSRGGFQALDAAGVDPAAFKSGDYDAFGVLERRIAACQAAGSLQAESSSPVLAALVWTVVHGIAVLEREGALSQAAMHVVAAGDDCASGRGPAAANELAAANLDGSLLDAFARTFRREGPRS